MTDPRTAEIAKLEESIALLEAQQRAGADLSLPLQLQRERLAQLLEQAAPAATTVNQSGGIDVQAERVGIEGDVVGRDKIASNTATNSGSGSIAQGDHAQAVGQDGVGVGGNVGGHVIQAGPGATVIVGKPPISSALPADEALARYLKHVIDDNSHLQLQGIRSSSGLVSIELEEIYITLTATELIDESRHLAPGEAQRMEGRRRETVQQVKVKVQEALHAHMRLVILGDPGCGKTTLLKYLALTFARELKGEAGLVEARLQLKDSRLRVLLPSREFADYLSDKDEVRLQLKDSRLQSELTPEEFKEYISGKSKDPRTHDPKLLLDIDLKLLLDFLCVYSENPIFQSADYLAELLKGGCIVLINDIDKVAELATRRHIDEIIKHLTAKYPLSRYESVNDLAKKEEVERLRLAESRLPIFLPLRDFAGYLQKKQEAAGIDGPKLLLDFLNAYFENQDIKLPERFFADSLTGGKCLVLLDGVDEVADLPTRHRIARIVEKFTITYPGNRYVVTSRLMGYTDAARLGENYEVTTVRDFTWEDIARFVTYWNRAIEAALAKGIETDYTQHQARKQTEALLKAIEGNARVRELAVNPLMLTVIALVQRYRAQLPERRAELYEEAIEVLLSHWDVAKGLSASMTVAGRELDAGDRRSLLEPVALWMMEQHAREIEADELRRQLRQQFAEMMGNEAQARKAVDAFLHLINERSGLLAERGQGIYAFSHLTFQEHLAARAVSDKANYIDYTLKRLSDSWWREVVLLEAGYLSMQGKQRVTALIQAIMDCAEEPEPYHNLVLAAECLRDVSTARVSGDLFGEVQRRLRTEFETPLRRADPKQKRSKQSAPIDLPALIRRRAAAAEALGRIESGGTGTQPAFWRLPFGEPMWVDVPEGEFWMGGEGNYDKPVHRVYLPAFKIAKVPITNAQYKFCVEARQVEAPEHWESGQIPRGSESHPVVRVSWSDVVKYCEWLSGITGKTITLPSEAQWEKAARGDRDQRTYPWGDEWDGTKCNNIQLSIGGKTPVGIFPEGISPYGCLDMAGNVWEWTASIQKAYPYRADGGREQIEVDTGQVVRGGSWSGDLFFASCASRTSYPPDYRSDYGGFRCILSCAPVQTDEMG